MTDKQALEKVLQLLGTLGPEAQKRVLNAVATFFNIDVENRRA